MLTNSDKSVSSTSVDSIPVSNLARVPIWFKSNVSNHTKRHLIKTFSWRIIGTLDTMLISFFVIGSLTAGFKIGIIETVTKMFLYFLHEKLWYRVNYGLDKRKKIIKKYFG